MKRCILVLLAVVFIVVIGSVAAGVYSLPPQFLPEPAYQLKVGSLYPTHRSVGDGMLPDNGPRAAIDRYVIDLGEIDQEPDFELSFVLAELPAETLWLGIYVTGGEGFGLLDADKPEIGKVRLELTRARENS